MSNIRFFLLGIFLFTYMGILRSQKSSNETPLSWKYEQSRILRMSKGYTYTLSDTAFAQSSLDTIYKSGVSIPVSINVMMEASLIFQNDSVKIYNLDISINRDCAVGFTFSHFLLTEGCKMFISDIDRKDCIGAFTSENNRLDGKFATRPLLSNKLSIEIIVPTKCQEIPILMIDKIACFNPLWISDIYQSTKNNTSCFQDIYCSTIHGAEKAILMWTFYDATSKAYYTCSGALVNQDVSSEELKPYVYTANHCGQNADLSSALFFFNYQNPDCGKEGGDKNFILVGASKLASKEKGDMFLMKLDEIPPPQYDVYYLGWDRTERGDLVSVVEGIHHPHGAKKASSKGTFAANSSIDFWRIRWDYHPTAPGSSGSPLLSEGYIIGNLSYGISSCSNVSGLDHYGKLRKQWDDQGGATKRLKDWLDPSQKGNLYLEGRKPYYNNVIIEAANLVPPSSFQPNNKIEIRAKELIETKGNVVQKPGGYYQLSAPIVILNNGFQVEEGADLIIND